MRYGCDMVSYYIEVVTDPRSSIFIPTFGSLCETRWWNEVIDSKSRILIYIMKAPNSRPQAYTRYLNPLFILLFSSSGSTAS